MGDTASNQKKISYFIVFLRMKQIISYDLTVGLIKLEALLQCVYPNEANGGIYWTINIIVGILNYCSWAANPVYSIDSGQ